MAITTTNVKSLNAVRLFSQVDDAIDHKATDWDAYNKNPLDETLIKMVEGKIPTVLLCNFDFKGKNKTKIDDSMFGVIDKEEKTPKITYSNWAYEVVRNSLKAIENPPDVKDVIKIKFDSGTLVSDETMTKLQNVGIVSEIFRHWQTIKVNTAEELNAKN